MKIAIFSWYFPPTQTMGALRLGKAAKYLAQRGHDLRIIAADKMPFPQTVPVEVPRECVSYTPWIDVNRVSLRPSWLRRPTAPATNVAAQTAPVAAPSDTSAGRSRRLRLWALYQTMTNFPDGRVGWAPFAWKAGERLLRRWRPDVIFASGPPFTTLLVAASLAERHRLPCVLEFRDRWAEDPYDPSPRWRQAMERACQNWMVARSVGLVTVSEPWADAYRTRYGKPVTVVYNGFDAADYQDGAVGAVDGRVGSERLHIGYTGGIYPGRRDPTPLFQAIASMGDERENIVVEFVGTPPNLVWPLAEAAGARDQVVIHPRVPYAESIRAQQNADVLLLMQWNNPLEQGNVPGKLFEYLGARRPILGLGLDDGVPATIIRDNDAGRFANDPSAIANALRAWLAEKRRAGRIAPLPNEVSQRFTRDRQNATLETFLAERIGVPTRDATEAAQWSHESDDGAQSHLSRASMSA